MPPAIRNLFLIFSALSLFAIGDAVAEFYKYTDDRGRTHYVDDMSKVPDAYHFQVEHYAEPQDDLSDTERDEMIQLNRQQDQAAEAERQRNFEKIRQEHLKGIREYLEHKKAAAVKETPIEVRDRQILVPVTLGYGNRKVTTTLLLDTGASILALHKPVADHLDIHRYRKAKAQVASGDIIDTLVAKLSYIEIGPNRIENVRVSVFPFSGKSSHHSGLLGMEVLQQLRYTLDLEKQVIRWDN